MLMVITTIYDSQHIIIVLFTDEARFIYDGIEEHIRRLVLNIFTQVLRAHRLRYSINVLAIIDDLSGTEAADR